MNLKTLSDQELLDLVQTTSQKEKDLTLEVIKLIKEVDSRKLFLELGYGSLFDYARLELKYAEGSALRRINAARLLKELSEMETKIQEGVLSLSNVSQAQSFFRKEIKIGKTLTLEDKKQILTQLEYKSTREAQKTLIELSPDQIELKESEKVISADLIEIKMIVSEKLNSKLKKLKSLLSHTNPNMTQSELLEKLADMALKKLDPEAKANSKNDTGTNLPPAPKVQKDTTLNLKRNSNINLNTNTNLNPREPFNKSPSENPRYIPNAIKHQVYKRDQGCCSYFNPQTKNKCSSKHLLQYDHVKPIAFGGVTNLQNLRLLCHAHHRLITEKIFGKKIDS